MKAWATILSLVVLLYLKASSAISTNQKLHRSISKHIFLCKELGLRKQDLESVEKRFPTLFKLSVESNIRPTIEVLRSFGFKTKDLRQILKVNPRAFSLNSEWTLPEKLLELEQAFGLSRRELLRTVKSFPLLLTTRRERHAEVIGFFANTVGLEKGVSQVKRLAARYPPIFYTDPDVLRGIWETLRETLGLSTREAQKAIIVAPAILSRKCLASLPQRVTFLSNELSLPPPPCREMQRILLRDPRLLLVDTDRVIRQNLLLLRRLLPLSPPRIRALISASPSVLVVPPARLQEKLFALQYWLSGNEDLLRRMVPPTMSVDDADAMRCASSRTHFAVDDRACTLSVLSGLFNRRSRRPTATNALFLSSHLEMKNETQRLTQHGRQPICTCTSVQESSTFEQAKAPLVSATAKSIAFFEAMVKDIHYADEPTCDELAQYDVLGDLLSSDQQQANLAAVRLRLLRQSSPLCLDAVDIEHVLKAAPQIVVRRLHSHVDLLSSLVISLALTQREASRVVRIMPRLLNLSVHGKFFSIMRNVAHFVNDVGHWLDDDSPAALWGEDSDEAFEAAMSIDAQTDVLDDARIYRQAPVRRALRRLVVRYPHLLCHSLNHVLSRLEDAKSLDLRWGDVPQSLRRSAGAHDTFLRRKLRPKATPASLR